MTKPEKIQRKFDMYLKDLLHTTQENRWAVLNRAAQDPDVGKGMLFFLVGIAYPDLRGPQ